MEKLTVSRLGQPKTIQFINKNTNQPDSFQKIGFQTNEYPDRWFDFTFRGAHGLTIGQSYDLEIASREYNGKTYWDARLPKGTRRGSNDPLLGDAMIKLDRIYTEVYAIRQEQVMIRQLLQQNGVLPTPHKDYPNQDPHTAFDGPQNEDGDWDSQHGY